MRMISIRRRHRMSSFQVIILGYMCVILLGSCLLMFPISSQEMVVTPFGDALFTATSAVCVTGLIVHDTASYWSIFGQGVILSLIQIGGMGVITVAAAFTLISGRKISLMQRSTMQEAISAPEVGGIVRLTGFIIRVTLMIEMLGTVVMAPVFCKEFGWKGIWMALFHAVSAFCNAGFDLMGEKNPFSSLTEYASQPIINLTVMALIVVGGIGFLTWEDVRFRRWDFHRYRMQSKVILCTTALLLIAPAIYFFFGEFGDLPIEERLLASLFQSVTPRTAGFNTVDLTVFSEPGIAILILLMLIGGSPGSTAGGMKTTTVTVLFASAIATFRRKETTEFFGRRVEKDVVSRAATILIMYIVLFLAGGLVICIAEDLPLQSCLFETASAIGTVGLSLGVTPALGSLSRAVLIVLMFMGRVGGLTLVFATLSGKRCTVSRLPQEKITVG